VFFISLDSSIIRIHACKRNVLAKVVSSLSTQEARAAGDAGLNSNSVTCTDEQKRLAYELRQCGCNKIGTTPLTNLYLGYSFAALKDNAGRFMSENAIALYHQCANSASLPEVNI
jgi:hypothetical protein